MISVASTPRAAALLSRLLDLTCVSAVGDLSLGVVVLELWSFTLGAVPTSVVLDELLVDGGLALVALVELVSVLVSVVWLELESVPLVVLEVLSLSLVP